MARQKHLLGNWKMFKGPSDALKLARALKDTFQNGSKPDVVAVFPIALSVAVVRETLSGSTIAVGVQNVHWEKEGAFTGEISAPLAADAGCRFALIGHSERRQYFGETDETVNKRTKAVLAANLVPVVCIGETLAERDAGETNLVLSRQLGGALAGLQPEAVARAIIAYEPVWAIGTGRTASTEQAEAAHLHIRNEVRARSGALADSLPIVYGGSVKPDNAKGLMSQQNIDGALVGGASLDANHFFAIGEAF
jgi:triosephosphate isomerase